MLHEPGHYRRQDADSGLRFLLLSNILLSHLSALGAHRHRMTDDEDDAQSIPVAKRLSALMDYIAGQLASGEPCSAIDSDVERLLEHLELEDRPMPNTDTASIYRPVQSQLRLIATQLPPIVDVANRLTASASHGHH